MKISVYTPTHNPCWIGECYKSLRWQKVQDFEWILVLNQCGPEQLPAAVRADPRVRVLRHDEAAGNVGYLKYLAVAACTGDLLVELDHDDVLTPPALETLAEAAQRTPDAFYFSDHAGFQIDGKPVTYRSDHGWQTYPYTLWDTPFTVHRAFPTTARSLCEIFYAPNHVRAWSRTAYEKAGGYDGRLPVTDDQDLLCRTYLAGVPFVHLPQCLYLQRFTPAEHGGSTSTATRNAEIQQRQTINCHKYLYALAEEWTRREGLRRLDLGGAHNAAAGYETVDLHDADWVWDVAQDGIPALEGTVGIVRAFDFIEHLPRDRFVPFMNDLYRALAPGGWLLSATPSTDGRGAFQDPTHTNYINEQSFWYYTNRDYAKYVPAITCRFQAVRLVTTFPSDWHKQHRLCYVYADLCTLKGQHHPGLQQI